MNWETALIFCKLFVEYKGSNKIKIQSKETLNKNMVLLVYSV